MGAEHLRTIGPILHFILDKHVEVPLKIEVTRGKASFCIYE
jgi:hypothetical protein